MKTSAKTSATPAQPKDKPAPRFIFEWYENRIQRDAQKLYRSDQSQRHLIVEIIEEMNDSNLFSKLLACYSDTVMEAKDDYGALDDALLALCARVYILGTERGATVLQ